jgi:hypothetical protein
MLFRAAILNPYCSLDLLVTFLKMSQWASLTLNQSEFLDVRLGHPVFERSLTTISDWRPAFSNE